MKRTVAAVISSPKIPAGAPRTFLSSLVKRKPCVVVGEAEAVRMAERGALIEPSAIAESYWALHAQPRTAWTHELDLRPYCEKF